jgi:hypothetical protein
MFNRDDYLRPKLLQVIGAIAFMAQIVFWAVTAIVTGHGQSQSLFLGPCLMLIFVGQYQETVRALKRPSVDPTPPPVDPDAEREA